jgi:hypothetical protein
MPRKKRTIVEETLPDNPSIENDDIADMVCVLSKVYKLNTTGKSFCFQTTDPVDEVSIQIQYPTGGKFIVQEYNSMAQVLNTTHIDIEPKPLAAVANGNGGDIRSQMLLDELAFTRNMMLQLINGLVNNKGQQAATPLGELAQAMQVVHQMGSANNPVDLIIKGMELGVKSTGGAPDWKAQLVETAKDVLPAVMQTMNSARQVQPQGPPTMIQAPATMIKQGIDWIKPRIIGGMDTDSAVNWLITNANDPMCNQLLMHAAQGIESFIAIDPEIANEPYKTWFSNAILALKEWYAAQSTNQDDNDGGTGDDTDTPNDESVGTGKSTIRKIG